MICPIVKRMRCKILQNHHIEHHMNRYIETLTNKEYLASRGMSQEAADKEIAGLWERRRQLQVFDEIRDGKRQKKIDCIFLDDPFE